MKISINRKVDQHKTGWLSKVPVHVIELSVTFSDVERAICDQKDLWSRIWIRTPTGDPRYKEKALKSTAHYDIYHNGWELGISALRDRKEPLTFGFATLDKANIFEDELREKLKTLAEFIRGKGSEQAAPSEYEL